MDKVFAIVYPPNSLYTTTCEDLETLRKKGRDNLEVLILTVPVINSAAYQVARKLPFTARIDWNGSANQLLYLIHGLAQLSLIDATNYYAYAANHFLHKGEFKTSKQWKNAARGWQNLPGPAGEDHPTPLKKRKAINSLLKNVHRHSGS